MTMKLADFERLKSLMRMTASDNDNEALQAIRAANRLLMRDHGLTWDKVFARTVTVVSEIEAAPPDIDAASDADDELDRAFQRLVDTLRPSGFRDTVLSIHAQYQRNGSVSPRQREMIINAANNDRG